MGLDEAGYGPTLGPLVVAATAFRFENEPPEDLWRLLRRSVTRAPRRRDRRIPILDSKVLFTPRRGIAPLEEAVLSATRASRPGADEDVESDLGLRFTEADSIYPWYREHAIEIPLAADTLRTRARASRLAADLEDHGGAYLGARAIPLEARDFNSLVEEKGNKSIALFSIWSRLLRRWLPPDIKEPVRVVADRHGGRKSYLGLLDRYLPDLRPSVLEEGPIRSDYSLAGGKITLSFQVRAEADHLQVALASMVAKYVREVRMHSFNRFWAGCVGGLRPTSGYYGDAGRFLEAIRPAMRRMRLPPNHLVRCK